jgi:hypothetical protein
MANEGPTMTKATYDKKRTRGPVSSPERRKAELDQLARDCADAKLLRKDPGTWLDKHLPRKS